MVVDPLKVFECTTKGVCPGASSKGCSIIRKVSHIIDNDCNAGLIPNSATIRW